MSNREETHAQDVQESTLTGGVQTGESSRKKRIFVMFIGVAVVAALLIAWYARTVWLSENASVKPFFKYHEMGEKVDLDGSISYSPTELTKGYSLKVLDAKLVSYNEFIENYATDKETEYSFDEKSVVVLEVEFTNVENYDGHIDYFGWELVPIQRRDENAIVQFDLLRAYAPHLDNQFGFMVYPNTTKKAFVPFGYNRGEESKIYGRPITDRDFELTVTRYPIRNIIKIHLNEE